MRLLRKLSPIAFLACYLAQTLFGQALHEMQCGSCGTHCVAHAKCSHTHGSDHSHDDGCPGEKTPHDPSECAVCHSLAQAQLNSDSFIFDTRAEAVIAFAVPQPDFLVAHAPLGFLSRGPPAA